MQLLKNRTKSYAATPRHGRESGGNGFNISEE
jgi:hypothetical protein